MPGDGAGGGGVVAGDHLHPDAGRVALGHRLDGLGAWRVDQADQADQRELPLQVGGVQDRCGPAAPSRTATAITR